MFIPNTVIIVNEEPYCIWDLAPEAHNQEYLNSIDSRYFEYVAQLVIDKTINESSKSHSATLLRFTYYHALETFFSYIGALIQGPDGVCAWIQKASTGDIKAIVEKIDNNDNSLQRKLDIPNISWENIADIVFQGSDSDPAQVSSNVKNYSKCWSRLAQEFLRPSSRDEFNAMKHGLRIRNGGFSLLMAPELEPGISPPPEEMKTIAHSDYGSSYFTLEQCPGRVKGNRSYKINRQSLNWGFDSTAGKLIILSNSIYNIVSFLKVLSGTPFENVQFVRFSDSELYDLPWQASNSHCHFNFGFNFGDERVLPTNRQQLINFIKSPGTNSSNSGGV